MKESPLYLQSKPSFCNAGLFVAVICCTVVTSLAWVCIIYSWTRCHYTNTCPGTNSLLSIFTLKLSEPPKFIRRMKTNKTVMEGETVVLECQARGNPHPKVEWLKDSKPTVLTLRHFSTGESQFLIIVQTNRDDEGHLCLYLQKLDTN